MTVESFACKLEEGNPLTSMQIADESRVDCVWFEGAVLSQHTFEAALLRPVPEQEEQEQEEQEPDKSLSETATVSSLHQRM